MSVRGEIVAAARWGVRNAARIHYAESPPVPLRRTLPLSTDSSGFAMLCYFREGAADPAGLGYIGQGYTGHFLRHLPHIPAGRGRPGDIIVWGPYPGHHCAVLLEAGGDPPIASHRSERGPPQPRPPRGPPGQAPPGPRRPRPPPK